jgi:iron complex transport system substrate-binding protein
MIPVSRLLALCLLTMLALARPALAADAPPQERYLIIGSYLAEIVVALGATDQVVGVSGGTDHVPELAGVPVIPGFRNLSAESMLSLEPTIALLAGRQTRPEIITQLEAAGVEVHFFSDDLATLDVVKERVREVGALLGREQEAAALVARFEADLADALAFVAQASSRPKGLFILSGGGRPTVVAGADTHIALLIGLAGAQNLTTDMTDYKPMSQEAMLAAAPDFILVNVEGLEQRGDQPVALSAPGATLTPAARDGRVFAIPNGFLQGLGINSPQAIREIAKRVHPELAQEP